MLLEKEMRRELKSTIEKKFGTGKSIEPKRGEIYWCDLGLVNNNERDYEQKGLRPCIIIQNDIGNKFSPTVIVAAITSQMNKAKLPTHVAIEGKNSGLSKDSVILTEQQRTLDKKKVGDFIGTLTAEDTIKLNKAISISLGLVELAHIEKTNNINSTNNVTDITIIRKITEKAKEIEELDTTLKVLVARNIDIKMMKPILLERQDKIREFYIICENNNINPDKYYVDYNKKRSENNHVKTC